MTDEINVLSRTQQINVEPTSGAVSVINAGPAGPGGSDVTYSAPQSINPQTGTSYTLVASDKGKLITLNNASAITLTVPQDSAASFSIGCWCEAMQLAGGQVTVVAGTGATLVSTPSTKTRAMYSRIYLQKIAANTWALAGDLVPL